MVKKECVGCKTEFETKDKRRKFCTQKCGTTFNNKNRIVSDSAKNKIANSLKNYYKQNPRTQKQIDDSVNKGQTTKGKYKNPTNILELSSRTISKIIKRLKIGCSNCGWDEAPGDIHHINGRKISDANNHKNLTYLCPNCHRKCHCGLIDKNKLINLEDYIGDKWKEYYYG